MMSAAVILGVVAGAGAMITGPFAQNQQAPISSQRPIGPDAIRMVGTDSETGVHADVALESTQWGTLVSFTVSDIEGPRECRLVVVRTNGKTEVISSWTVPDQGYNEGTEPPKLELEAATSIPEDEIAAVRVQEVGADGSTTKTLLTIES